MNIKRMWPYFKKPSHATVKVRILDREISKLRLNEFRADEKLCQGMLELTRNAYFRIGCDVLNNEHPGNVVFPPDVSLETRACHQARCEGYTLALSNLEALAKHKKPVSLLESTFEDPEEVQTQ